MFLSNLGLDNAKKFKDKNINVNENFSDVVQLRKKELFPKLKS